MITASGLGMTLIGRKEAGSLAATLGGIDAWFTRQHRHGCGLEPNTYAAILISAKYR